MGRNMVPHGEERTCERVNTGSVERGVFQRTGLAFGWRWIESPLTASCRFVGLVPALHTSYNPQLILGEGRLPMSTVVSVTPLIGPSTVACHLPSATRVASGQHVYGRL